MSHSTGTQETKEYTAQFRAWGLPESQRKVKLLKNNKNMMTNKPFKVIKKNFGTEYWTKIKAHQAKNWDGSSAGYVPNTPNGERGVTEKRFVPSDKDLPTRYTNYW